MHLLGHMLTALLVMEKWTSVSHVCTLLLGRHSLGMMSQAMGDDGSLASDLCQFRWYAKKGILSLITG